MLEIRNLSAGYGPAPVLHDVSIDVQSGEIVALIGPNTAGKSSLLRVISRILIGWCRGSVRFLEQSLIEKAAHQIAGMGIAHVLEGRQIFPQLTVAENLRLGAWSRRRSGSDLDADQQRVLELFPRLGERMSQTAGTLSGGEQQMVAVGRALMVSPRLLLLDEPSHGLAPMVVDELYEALKRIHEQGVSILLVEQNAQLALTLSSRAYVLSNGRTELSGESRALLDDDHVRTAYLGI
ncbi:MAG: ABC transporter ATP-binding protein [Burkholderiaceae bacterium]|jgi:branched-chain amino acid transport system ATP-binding protein|nr:ABC transporter ATP-binding protein [Burkholderiaceae bacterium]